MSVACVVVAAGSGTRAGLGYNKVLYRLAGRTVLSRTLDALKNSGLIDTVILVMNEADRAEYEKIELTEGKNPLIRCTVPGGPTRRDSVYEGLKVLDPETEIVLVHDAARPFVSDGIIRQVIDDARTYGSGVISTLITDTVKRIDESGSVIATEDRDRLRCVQTPQAFAYRKLLQAHESADKDLIATDDASLYEQIYGSVHLSVAPEAKDNIKLTTKEDIMTAERRFLPRLRCGTGYDVHRLIQGRKLILCGVEIPFDRGLLGHSDADVALHALMDAMLGAAALGDIGKLFPDSDDSFLGISSMILLEKTAEALKNAEWRVSNCDITIVCQRPKLAPFIEKMRENIAGVLKVGMDRVSVKATTTEGLGFEGEGLGISAQASVTLEGIE